MKKKLLITVIAVIVVLATVLGMAACNDTLSDGIFSGGCIAVMDEYGKWGYVDSNGKEVIGFDYASATNFVNGVAVVSYADSGAFYLIDAEGTHLAGPFDNTVRVVADTIIIVKDSKTGKFGVYDTAAKAFSYDFVYDAITPVGDTSVVRMESTINRIEGVEYVDLATGSVTVARKFADDEFTIDITGAYDDTDGHNFYFYNTTENGEDVFKGVNVLTGVEAVTWNGGKSSGNDWTYLINYTYDAEGSVTATTYHYVTETAIIALDKDVEVPQTKEDGSMLLTEKTAEGSDGTSTTTYTLYGKDGVVIYSGTEQPVWDDSNEAYYITKTENGTLTLNVYKDGALYSVSAVVPEGASGVNCIWGIDTEENAIDMEISYSVTTGEGENTTTESISKNLVSVSGTTVEIPEEYTYVGVSGGKLILTDKARARVGVFNTDMSAVTECIYSGAQDSGAQDSGAQVVDGGYIVVKMGDAYGVLAPDGSTVLDCVYYGIAVA